MAASDPTAATASALLVRIEVEPALASRRTLL